MGILLCPQWAGYRERCLGMKFLNNLAPALQSPHLFWRWLFWSSWGSVVGIWPVFCSKAWFPSTLSSLSSSHTHSLSRIIPVIGAQQSVGSNLLGGSWGDLEVPFSIWKGKFKRFWVLPYKRVSHLSLVTVTESGVCAICNRQICWSFLSFRSFLCGAAILWIWSFQFWRVGLPQ